MIWIRKKGYKTSDNRDQIKMEAWIIKDIFKIILGVSQTSPRWVIGTFFSI